MDTNSGALNEEVEQNNPDTTPVSEEKVSEEVRQAPEGTEPTGEATEEAVSTETDGEPKKGYSQRVRELNAKAKSEHEARIKAEAEANSLRSRIAGATGSIDPNNQFIPQVQPGAEVSPEQYQQHVMQTADALVTLKIKQSEAVNRINNETQDVIRNYPELDPESDSFNKELSETVSEATEAYIRQNPYSGSVKQYVEKLMRPYKGAVAKEVGEATETIAKQVSQTALRPTTIRKGEKSPEEMTPAELEKKLGVVQA